MNNEELKEKYTNLIQQKCPGAIPLLITIVGSQAYGTNLPTSDLDVSGIYIQSQDDIYGLNYKEQIDEKKKKVNLKQIKMTQFSTK